MNLNFEINCIKSWTSTFTRCRQVDQRSWTVIKGATGEIDWLSEKIRVHNSCKCLMVQLNLSGNELSMLCYVCYALVSAINILGVVCDIWQFIILRFNCYSNTSTWLPFCNLCARLQREGGDRRLQVRICIFVCCGPHPAAAWRISRRRY